jgi:7-carboxy-7-deazaguanine synthase|tara:strand:+ start:33 stop:674 length:642 start_codon:yes stop_codon:yes gene_type:complete
MKSLIVNEIFYSIQGESLSSGLPTIFIRLTGCPLRCQYCDTSYAFTEGKKKTFEKIIQEIKNYNCTNVTITGGEPLSQKNTKDFINLLVSDSYNVSIETSNAVSIKNINDSAVIVLDIKTPDSNESDKNIIENYKFLKECDQIKFVICSKDDYQWAKNYINKYNLNSICNIIMSPSFGEMDIQVLAEFILKDNLPARLQTQLHKLIWNDQRGR